MTGPLVAPGAGEAVRALVPQWAVPVFVVITTLGSVAVLLGLVTTDYWFVDHERGAHELAIAVAGIALLTALKAFFAVPRPEDPTIRIDGYSFPSGHALGSTVVYGVLAAKLRIGTRRARAGVAAALVSLIALSRVVLGVHYVRDVVAGVAVGLAFLYVALRATDGSPKRGFALAAGLGTAAFLISGASHHGTAVFGASLGALLAWFAVGDAPSVRSSDRRVALAVVGFPSLLALAYLGTEVSLAIPLVFALNAAVLGLAVAAPAVVARP